VPLPRAPFGNRPSRRRAAAADKRWKTT
jgi:hypothetical protein